MRVESISLFQNRNFNQSSAPQGKSAESSSMSAFSTSIYNQKGVALPFGAWAKGIDAAENECIKFLRKARKHRCRQYTEPEIIDYITLLRGGHEKQGREKIHVLKDIFTLYDDNVGGNPEDRFIKNVLKVTKEQPENEYWSVLEFAQHELKMEAVEPLGALANAPKEKQDRFIQLMSMIKDVNEPKYYMNEDARQNQVSALYEDLSSVIYTSEDLPKMKPEDKMQALSDVYYDLQKTKESQNFSSFYARNKVLKVSREIFGSLMEILKT